MDARKIHFLIGMQREIDKLEAKEGNTPKIERIKSRFYDVVEVDEVANSGQSGNKNSTGAEEISIRVLMDELKLSKPKYHRKHDPKGVGSFLSSFKIDNTTGCKNLVHSPDDPSTFDYYATLHKALKFCIDIFQENYLPKKLSERVILLFDTLTGPGLIHWNVHKTHPLYNDKGVTKVIQDFKKNYRFDTEETEASILRNLITNIANWVTYSADGPIVKFNDRFCKLQFNPNADFFDVNNIFFADVESFKIGLSVLFQSLIKHTNIGGQKQFDRSEKKLVIETKSETTIDGYNYKLTICDVGATIQKKPYDIIKNLREEQKVDLEQSVGNGIASRFLSVCDWSIEGVFAGVPQRLIIQPFNKIEESILPVKDGTCAGFTHIFTFYNV
jgi:hypothetical protein